MASLEASGRPRDVLPSIVNLDFEKYRLEKSDYNRYSMPNVHSVSKPPTNSPPTNYSGPPPPYSSSIPAPSAVPTSSGYISPPESSSRRSTRDEKDSPKASKSLPSISEALKSADVASASQSYNSTSAPGSAVGQSFSDAPRGPGNPFSQPAAPASALRSSISTVPDSSPTNTVPPPPIPTEPRQMSALAHIGSPRLSAPQPRLSGSFASSNPALDPPFQSAHLTESARPGYPFPDLPAHRASLASLPSGPFQFNHSGKIDDSRNPFTKPESVPYGETVKRHLDIFDAELTLSEIYDSSNKAAEYSKYLMQQYQQANRQSYYADRMPSVVQIEEMLKLSNHMLDNLVRLREASVNQQNALEEQRARVARGQHLEEDFHRMSDEYKVGGFAGGDAKKRRGKAAPPGRCHSCNRAETPEWRRGPDGARTLCNACGLHYAKLTRKLGTTKAAVMSGSNLRPKNPNDTR